MRPRGSGGGAPSPAPSRLMRSTAAGSTGSPPGPKPVPRAASSLRWPTSFRWPASRSRSSPTATSGGRASPGFTRPHRTPLTGHEGLEVVDRRIKRADRPADVLRGGGGADESSPSQQVDPLEEQGEGEVLRDRGHPLDLESGSGNVAEGCRIPGR